MEIVKEPRRSRGGPLQLTGALRAKRRKSAARANLPAFSEQHEGSGQNLTPRARCAFATRCSGCARATLRSDPAIARCGKGGGWDLDSGARANEGEQRGRANLASGKDFVGGC